MNMFKPAMATTIKGYLAAIADARRKTILFLHGFIQKTTPKLKAYFANNMLGYGSFPYRSHNRELIRWPVVALANQKNYISIYICALDNGEYIAEKYKMRLGKVSVGRSCIRFKKLEDINLTALSEVLKHAATKPGLGSVN